MTKKYAFIASKILVSHRSFRLNPHSAQYHICQMAALSAIILTKYTLMLSAYTRDEFLKLMKEIY